MHPREAPVVLCQTTQGKNMLPQILKSSQKLFPLTPIVFSPFGYAEQKQQEKRCFRDLWQGADG